MQPSSTQKNPPNLRRTVKIAVSFLAAIILSTALYKTYDWLDSGGVSRIPFNSATWISTPATFNHDSVRQRMVDDLLNSGVINGLSRPQITALLGPPENTTYFADNDFVYMVGPERGFIQIDSEWLTIKLDAAGKAVEARLRTD